MIAALVLVAFVVLASTMGRTVLLRAAWVQSSPRWGIWSWQALSLAIASAVVLAAIAVAVPLLPIRSTLAQWAQITPLELDEHYETPGGPWIAAAALSLALVVVARFVVLTVMAVRDAADARRRQVQTLSLVGAEHPDGYVLVDHAAPLVYCLPGRGRKVVVTSSAEALLSPHELQLVLAHERTHLRARHDLALAASGALATTFRPFRFFSQAHAQIAMLVEMQADDAARAAGDRRVLARALVALSTSAQQPAPSSGDALARVRRLTSPSPGRLSIKNSAVVGLMTALLLSAPVGLAMAPAIEASTRDCCDPDL